MSIINKVLRDLDQRAATGDAVVAAQAPAAHGSQVPPGVVAVPALPAAPFPRRRVKPWWPLPVLLVLAAVGAIGWWQSAHNADPAPRGDATVPPAVSTAVVPPPAASQAADVAAVVALAAAPAPAPARAATTAPVPAAGASDAAGRTAGVPAAVPLSEPSSPAALQPIRQIAVAPVPPPAPEVRPSAAVAAAAAPADLPPVALPSPVPWPEAALDAVGQAQRLWSSGAPDTALAFLRDALAGMERVHGPDLLPGRVGAAAGLAMVRELVRMEQGLGNHAQVLTLLNRHEALWARQADLWAVRGSTAQRLSQHVEAAEAYRTALRLRPGEPRWMLGAAVSLAAQGQLTSAAPLVEQARALGPVSPDVLSYLRQLGVPVRGDNPGN